MLGFAEIARKARGIEDFPADPGDRADAGDPGMLAEGECVSRLRAEFLNVRELFIRAVRGKRETPDLPPAVRMCSLTSVLR